MKPLLAAPIVLLALQLQAPLAPVNVRLTTGGVGPLASITCPAGATRLKPGTNLPAAVNAATVRAFCLEAGLHSLTSPIVPKTGDNFIGEFGAILDGSGIPSSADGTSAVIRGWNCGTSCASVTIRNLVIRNQPSNCLGIATASGWVIDHNDISGCGYGLNVHGVYGDPVSLTVTANTIHHHGQGAYSIEHSTGLRFEGNEVFNGGPYQKILSSSNAVVRDNVFHHNQQQGAWMDGDNVGCLVERNVADDNGGSGFMHEVSGACVYRYNTARRNGESCVFISTSRNVEVYGNTCEDNFRGINLLVSCPAIAQPPYSGMMDRDLRDVSVHDNTISVGTSPAGSFASLFSAAGTCAKATAAAAGQSNNTFDRNHYFVSSLSWGWFYWQSSKTWSQWQALRNDPSGTFATR